MITDIITGSKLIGKPDDVDFAVEYELALYSASTAFSRKIIVNRRIACEVIFNIPDQRFAIRTK